MNKPTTLEKGSSKRMANPTNSAIGEMEGKDEEEPASLPGKSPEMDNAVTFPFDPGGGSQKVKPESRGNWEWDPTPPHLTTPLPSLGDTLPDAPVILHPDLMQSLTSKAMARWDRTFDLHAQAGRSRRVAKEQSYVNTSFGTNDRGLGQASLIIPSARRVEKVMRTLLKLREKNPATLSAATTSRGLPEQ